MSKRHDTWMPFYVGDYLADTMHLTRDQHGAYLLLIFAYWRAGEPLLDDDEELAAITKSTAAEWKKLRRTMARFFIVGDGKWHHKRIDAEIEKAGKIKVERSKAGSEGAAKRWQKHGKVDGKPIANAIANATQDESQNDAPSPSSSSLRSEEDSGTDVPGGKPPPSAPDPVKAMWDRGVAILGPKSRSLLGQMISRYKAPAVLAAIVECENEQPVDPVPYFVACCERRKGNGSGRGSSESAVNKLGAWAMGEDEQEIFRGHH